jgi:phosphatidylserine/phosphatidylglycerophosphate/cardiolipin synthase-like enzyme
MNSKPRTMSSLGDLEKRYLGASGPIQTANSLVVPHIDGVDFFGVIQDAILTATSKAAIYLTNWWLEPGMYLVQRGAPNFQWLQSLLANAAGNGADVRVILWANPNLQPEQFSAWYDVEASAAASRAGGFVNVVSRNISAAMLLRSTVATSGATPLSDRVLLDWSGDAFGSHHMKTLVVADVNDTVAFASGLDFEPGRFDDVGHVTPRILPTGETMSEGWHDAGVEVHGPAANDILNNFVTRWTECSTLPERTFRLHESDVPYNPDITSKDLAVGGGTPISTNTSVRIARTYGSAKMQFAYGLGPNTEWSTSDIQGGVSTVRDTLLTAIAGAQTYVYIEDQAFDAPKTLFPAIAAAASRGVKVIFVGSGCSDPIDGTKPVNLTLNDQIQSVIVGNLTANTLKNFVFYRVTGLVIHSKTTLIDDVFMCIGSANCMDRSMQETLKGVDTELSVAAVDNATLVRDLRVTLWSDHMRRPNPDPNIQSIQDINSVNWWRSEWNGGVTADLGPVLVMVGP